MKPAIIALLFLAGCATSAGPVVCPVHVQPWSFDDQQAALADEQTLPANSPLIAMLSDYATMRNEARACLKASD